MKLGLTNQNTDKPAPDALLETWPIRLVRYTLWFLFRLIFRLEFAGRENVPASGPCIIAPNHQTYLDPLFVGLGMKSLAHYMAWDRLFRMSLLGKVIAKLGAFPVDVLHADKSSYKRSLEILGAGGFLVVFPEGGRTKRGKLDEFKPGVARMALAAGATLVPCTILGGDRVWPSGQRLPRPGKIRLIYHPPMHIAKESFDDPDAEKARIAEVLSLLRTRILTPLL